MDIILKEIKSQGFKVSRTHFDFLSIKTDMPISDLKSLMLNIVK
jgi:tRNA G26 N,N-dimethylase Trm1